MKKIIRAGLAAFLPVCSSLQAMTIEEKKESFSHGERESNVQMEEQLSLINALTEEKRKELQMLHQLAIELHQKNAQGEEYRDILLRIQRTRLEIAEMEEMWRQESSSFAQIESYALWNQPETTIQQLVMDYGAQEYVYLVPPEVGAIRLSLNSSLSIPRQSWSDCLEMILSSHGIGVRQLNPFVRELYLLRHDPRGIERMTSDLKELDHLPPLMRICYVLTPSESDGKATLQFLQKFSNPTTTVLHLIGGKVFISSTVDTTKELLKLYEYFRLEGMGSEVQLVALTKVTAQEMEKILLSTFQLEDGDVREGSSLRILPLQSLPQTLFLSGAQEEISKALKLIRDFETQIEDPKEKTVFWYTAKHSDPQELGNVLSKVYGLMRGVAPAEGIALPSSSEAESVEQTSDSSLIVTPASVGPRGNASSNIENSIADNHFVIDPKTSSLIMVVEKGALPKIKDLLKKLDVPKKMVQIEVLLLEKRVTNQSRFGLNLLRLGAGTPGSQNEPANKSQFGLSWLAKEAGILEFLISRAKGSGIPAYDLAYHFLLGQEDVQINASPSITTLNKTPATIAIVDEMSINMGDMLEDGQEKKNFSRAQYGITIQITPTIHYIDQDGQEKEMAHVTLDTDITFDTTKRNTHDRPDVTRRHIKNHVSIADGETVIIGGLRRKSTQDSKDSIPFLGEIPGLGKLFGTTDMNDSSTEMFIFITPKVIADPFDGAEQLRREELAKRPGDLPPFLEEWARAKRREKEKLFEKSFTALFGRSAYSPDKKSLAREFEGK